MSVTIIEVAVTVQVPLERAWECWTKPEHIVHWNSASADWHTPHASNDLVTGGTFLYRMEARDGSMGFDFGGVYDLVIPQERIEYHLGDGRKVVIRFSGNGNETTIQQDFDAETVHSVDLQRQGWQAIMDHYKSYSEQLSSN